MHTGTSTPLCAARSHSQQAIAVSMPCSVNIFRGDQHRWCRSRGSQSETQNIENDHSLIIGKNSGQYCWKSLNIKWNEAVLLTFVSYKQGGHLEHGLGEGLWIFSVQSTGHLMDHQLVQVWLAVSRLGELDHTSHLDSTETDRNESYCI